jgi:hypothetical protein
VNLFFASKSSASIACLFPAGCRLRVDKAVTNFPCHLYLFDEPPYEVLSLEEAQQRLASVQCGPPPEAMPPPLDTTQAPISLSALAGANDLAATMGPPPPVPEVGTDMAASVGLPDVAASMAPPAEGGQVEIPALPVLP